MKKYKYLSSERKLPYRTKLVQVRPDKPDGCVRLYGIWLSQNGFTPCWGAAVYAEPGRITVRQWDESYRCQNARQDVVQFLRVKNNRYTPYLDIPSECLEIAGFPDDCDYLAKHEYGRITLRKPENNVLTIPA